MQRRRSSRGPSTAPQQVAWRSTAPCGIRTDARHAVMRRDDVANLHRMYYWLLSTTLSRPGLTGATWVLRPTENGLMHWESVHHVSTTPVAGLSTSSVFSGGVHVASTPSSNRADALFTAPLIQIADLMAGLSAFTHEFLGVYESWCRCETDKTQLSFALPDDNLEATDSSRTIRERCHVLQHLNQRCKLRKMGVSWATHRGLTTSLRDTAFASGCTGPRAMPTVLRSRGERTALSDR